MQTIARYSGQVTIVLANERQGLIGLATVRQSDGSQHGLTTSHDILVRQDDCNSPLEEGLEVSFAVAPDAERGADALRAIEVSQIIQGELMPLQHTSGQLVVMSEPQELYVPPSPEQIERMKPVDPETVRGVIANRPMPGMPRRIRPSDRLQDLRRIAGLFPQFSALRNEDGEELSDEELDEVIRIAVADHKALGMETQANRTLRYVGVYKALKGLLQSGDDILSPQTIIPMQYLPDLFMAVPVWYFWTDAAETIQAGKARNSRDPEVHPKLQSICDLVPNKRWVDTFLMFNRRMRTLADYNGDVIPPKIIDRMKKLAPHFDHLVIMTPYHDVAGQDWQDLAWLRSIDPYVVGFLKGMPLMFVIGRFSDSGVFPLHSELRAETITFLRVNIEKLAGFNAVNSAFWSAPGKPSKIMEEPLGTYLINHTHELLAAFDRGELFGWLRNERPKA